MALFGNKKETKKGAPAKKVAAPASSKNSSVASASSELSMVLVRPHITEKAAQATARNVYTFEVSVDATKPAVAKAVKALYNVTPTAVRMVSRPQKRVSLRTRRGFGTKKARKYAYVSLKEGDRIEFAS